MKPTKRRPRLSTSLIGNLEEFAKRETPTTRRPKIKLNLSMLSG